MFEMRIYETEAGWVLRVGDDETTFTGPNARANAMAALTQAALAQGAPSVQVDDAAAEAITEHVAAELAADDQAGAEAAAMDGEGDDGADGDENPSAPALRVERWRSGPMGIVQAGPTGPGRDFSGCSFTWRDTPLPLMVQDTSDGHMGARLAGFITALTGRQDGGVDAEGTFLDNDAAECAIQIMRGGGRFWCSVDPSEYVTGEWVCTETDEEGWCVSDKIVFTAYEIAGLTLLPFQGFESCHVVLVEGDGSVTASAGDPAAIDLAAPPARWFQLAEPQDPTDDDGGVLVAQGSSRWAVPLTITADGQVFGHAAAWGTCHVGFPGACVTPPASEAAYAHFHVGEVVCDDGTRVPTGTLVCGADHAGADDGAIGARDHYAHNGLAWADVRVSNGTHGVWVCGSLRPGLTPEQVRALRASTLSGDWRRIGGSLELIGLLAVSVPGFPIAREAIMASALEIPDAPQARANVRAGVQTSLVASGIVMRSAVQLGAELDAGLVAECTTCADGRATARRRPSAAALAMADTRALRSEVAALAAKLEQLHDLLERRTRPLLATAARQAAALLDA